MFCFKAHNPSLQLLLSEYLYEIGKFYKVKFDQSLKIMIDVLARSGLNISLEYIWDVNSSRLFYIESQTVMFRENCTFNPFVSFYITNFYISVIGTEICFKLKFESIIEINKTTSFIHGVRETLKSIECWINIAQIDFIKLNLKKCVAGGNQSYRDSLNIAC
jgi:hypothetical protein